MITRYELQGLNLIEAAAGTGKTYTISRLYLRLLLEKGLGVKEILVVTFTVAATLELRERIRGLLAECRALAADGNPLPDGLPTPDGAVQTLTRAINEFDEAAIFTIHSFCDRVLRENCFESRVLFNTELMQDTTRLQEQVVEDFLRLNPAADRDTVKEVLKLHCRAPLAPFAASLTEAAESLDESGRRAIQCLKDCYANSRVKLGDFPQRYPEPRWPDHMHILDEVPTKQKDFTAALRELKRARQARTAVDFREFYRKRMTELRNTLNFRSFNDILLDLHAALYGDAGELLVRTIRHQYRAALIDECQDTDQLQFDIFRKLFIENHDMPCFLIGDPKQSIYGFRNADIFSYLAMRDRVDRTYPLAVNYRSSAVNITAVNSVFGDAEAPFILEGLDYQAVASSPESKGNKRPLTGGEAVSGIDFYHLGVPDRELARGTRPPEDSELCDAAVEAAAADIARLLSAPPEKISFGGEPVHPSDIAILTMTHPQARAMLDRLRAYNIPAVVQNNGNVLLSAEGDELLLLLQAMLDIRQRHLLNGALLSSLCGVTPQQLDVLLDDSDAYDAHVLRFKTCFALWERHGFYPMFRRFLDEYGVRARLLARSGGERRLTNLLQLGEILNAVPVTGPAALLDWFSRQRSDEETREYEMRLERDDEAVKIMTVFASKGLEFPLVFCPFFWSKGVRGQSRATFCIYHEAETRRAVFGMKDDPEAAEAVEREEMAEAMRLFYVGLTRARNKCFVYWNNAMAANPLSYLFGNDAPPTEARPGVRFLACAPTAVPPLPDRTDDEEFAPLPQPPAPHLLRCTWSLSSFSSLISGRHSNIVPAEDWDHDDDETGATAETAPEADGFIAFPRGANPGSFLHQVLEDMDFTMSSPPELERLIRRNLRLFNISSRSQNENELTRNVADMLKRLMNAPILPRSAFKLTTLPPEKRLTELEFHFAMRPGHAPLPEFDDYPELTGFLHGHTVPNGFMNGKIDLVFEHGSRFYVLDWKSNYLGPHPDHYHPDKLRRAIDHHLYNLQYLIYTVALDHYLSQRKPNYNYDKHFGGVVYVFLRGVGHGANGVFFDRPEAALIRQLGSYLAAAETEVFS